MVDISKSQAYESDPRAELRSLVSTEKERVHSIIPTEVVSAYRHAAEYPYGEDYEKEEFTPIFSDEIAVKVVKGLKDILDYYLTGYEQVVTLDITSGLFDTLSAYFMKGHSHDPYQIIHGAEEIDYFVSSRNTKKLFAEQLIKCQGIDFTLIIDICNETVDDYTIDDIRNAQGQLLYIKGLANLLDREGCDLLKNFVVEIAASVEYLEICLEF